jgi:hypothetical protein
VQYIRNAAIKACERTLAWRYAEVPYALTPGVFEYIYRNPQDTDVHAVFLASVNGERLEPLSLDSAVTRYPQWADLYGGVPFDQLWQGSGSYNEDTLNEGTFNAGPQFTLSPEAMKHASDPRVITQLTPDRFVVLPAPNDQKQHLLRLIYALKPKRASTGMDAVIFDELEDTIVHGALQELLVLPGMPWSDRELATYHAKQYLFYVMERRARANLGNVRGSMTVKMQPFV